MPSRLDRFGYGVTIPATTARVVDAAVEILGDPDPDEMAFMHSVLAQTFLPYRDPKTRDYMRQNGRASMVLTALRQAASVYPAAQVVDGGLLLRRSAPPIRRKGDGTLPARG